MARENEIIGQFVERFPFLNGRMTTPRRLRIFTANLSRAEFNEVVAFARNEAGFTKMHHVVGTDEGADLGFLYVMEDGGGVILALREVAPKEDPEIDTMTTMFPSMLWHERELVDLFGAKIAGMPGGPRYPLPDGWPEGNYPMRKDWNPKYFNRDTMTYHVPEDGEESK